MSDLSGDLIELTPTVHPTTVDPKDGFEQKPAWGLSAWLAVAWLGLVLIAVLFAPLLPLSDPLDIEPELREVAPGQLAEHPLGGDEGGRDMLSRVVYGARTSVGIGVLAVGIGLLVGGSLGLLAGYYRNWFSTALATLFDILLAFPGLLLALALVAFINNPGGKDQTLPEFTIVTLALGIVSIPILARITRVNAMVWSQREFVLAARAQGAKDSRILLREVLPNVVPAMGSIALLGIAVAIIAEGGLALLGAGIGKPDPSWGSMVASGRSELDDAPYIVFIPSTAIFLTVLSLNFLGDKMRERFDVREGAL